jgi:hypothetical protein
VKRVSVVAVLVGGIADILLTTLLSLPILVYAYSNGGIFDLPKAQQQTAALAFIHSSVALYSASFLAGAFSSVLAGYLAAWIAKHDEVLNGALSSFLCVGADIYAFGTGQFSGPPWLAITFLPLVPVLAAAGGYLRLVQARSKRSSKRITSGKQV